MRFIDSNIIAYAFYENELQERCQELIKEEGITNTIAITEAYNIIENEVNSKHADEAIKVLLKSNIKIIEVNINTIYEAIKRRTKYKKLKFIDLIHYTTALLYNCTEIASYDKDFNDLEIKRTT